MKSLIKRILGKIFHPLAIRIGYHKNLPVSEGLSDGKDVLLDNFYDSLHKIGFPVKHIVDVGANHGTWTRKALEHFPDAWFTLLEPQNWLKEHIKDLLDTNKKISFHGIGAGEKEGSFKFTIVERDDSCSFRFTEEEARLGGYKQIDIPVVTINSLLRESMAPIPDIIKIDAEGLDIEVVKGSSNYYGKTEIYMVEAGVMAAVLKNSVLNMINFMESVGYKLYDITDLNRTLKNNALWLVELVFIKKGGTIDNAVNSYV
jgi:FkbM family methyltransferase